MIYSEHIILPSYLCDCHDRLSLWGLARLFQDVAEHHCLRYNLGFEDLLKEDKSWVLTQMFYQIKQMPTVGDNIMLSTWSRGDDGLIAYRDTQITDADGNLLVGATAMWALIDRTKRRVVRLHDMMHRMESHNQQATTEARPPKIEPSAKATVADSHLSFRIQHSMLDHVMHVNNAEYIRWIGDMVHQDVIHELNVKFHKETKIDEQITLSRYNNTNTIEPSQDSAVQHCLPVYIQISNPRGLAVEASLS